LTGCGENHLTDFYAAAGRLHKNSTACQVFLLIIFARMFGATFAAPCPSNKAQCPKRNFIFAPIFETDQSAIPSGSVDDFEKFNFVVTVLADFFFFLHDRERIRDFCGSVKKELSFPDCILNFFVEPALLFKDSGCEDGLFFCE
jgi:hypothetical protein